MTKLHKKLLTVLIKLMVVLSALASFFWGFLALLGGWKDGSEMFPVVSKWVSDHYSHAETLRAVLVGVLGAFLITFGAAVLFGWLLVKEYKKTEAARAKQKQPVLFLPPSLEGFYSEYLTALVRAARKYAGTEDEITIVPYVDPGEDFCPEERLDAILEVLEHGGSTVKGVFIIPKDPDANRELLAAFNSRPIVTLDVYPSVEKLAGYPCFVGGNERMGGRCAAWRAISILRDAANQQPKGGRVMILTGCMSPWERQRVDEFMGTLRANAGPVSIVLSKELEYSYEKADQYLRNWQVEVDASGDGLPNPLSCTLIFACSDTMAFGAAKAIRHLRGTDPALSFPKIIGYDGTVGMRRTLDAGSDVFVATVNVNLEAQAEKAVELMMRLLRADRGSVMRPGGAQGDQMILVEPRVHP